MELITPSEMEVVGACVALEIATRGLTLELVP